MASKFEQVNKAWARDVFQGCAVAYSRFSASGPPQWEYLEKPLFLNAFSDLPSNATMLDFGAGPGKVALLATYYGFILKRNLTCYEPNPILYKELKSRLPSSRCVRRAKASLSQSSWAKNKFDIITANMVVNHMNSAEFGEFAAESGHILRPNGRLVYTIPHPVHEAAKLGIHPEIDEAYREVEAPWGGLTDYQYRSIERERQILKSHGFNQIGFISWGYEDSVPRHVLYDFEFNVGDDITGPRRLMVIAKKFGKISDKLLQPVRLS